MNTANAAVTPMMAQYLEIKEAHQDALLFYRMGDFYELFFDDAVAAAEALDIALTKRGKHLGEDIPMCGVPVHSAEGYLLALIRKGFRVAVCEQLEDPSEAKKRGSKAVVKRGVVRLVTPGTLTEDTLLEARRHNYLATLAKVRDEAALAWADISTGELRVLKTTEARFGPELARLSPSEVVVPDALYSEIAWLETDLGLSLTPLSQASFDSQSGEKRLCSLYQVQSLDAFGAFSRAELSALGALIDYLDLTQKGQLPLLQPPVRESASSTVQIDAATRRNLELTRALSGGRDGSLLAAIDRTVTAAGGRLLERRISSPSRDLQTIQTRLDDVEWLVNDQTTASTLRDQLKRCPDIERALSRLALDRGGPRDLAALRNALAEMPGIASLAPRYASELAGFDAIRTELENALVAEPPLLARDGGFVAPEYNAELDEAQQLRDEGRSVIAELQTRYADQTGISSLKIKHNNVLGYFIETTATHAEKMLALSETFIQRQTTGVQDLRFHFRQIDCGEAYGVCGGRALDIEKRLFEQLKNLCLDAQARLAAAARSLAELDVTQGFASMAASGNWCRPRVDETVTFEIKGGRHPVVEAALKREGGTPFIANDCSLSEDSNALALLLTGPNMAGKSTFLRQNALIALLAHAGSYVPAETAHIGLVSQIFSRVGAADDLARGRSTFMVEMVETAAILNQADEHALVILDEIGRGTSTYDGLSIAWATLENLHDVNRCRALFATHYHEMTELADRLDRASNATVAVKEWDGEVIFLHEVRKGAADRSYGIQVAKLAGLPANVVARARVVLDVLEKGEREGKGHQKAIIDDLPLFSAVANEPPPQKGPSQIEERLSEIHPDNLTPKEALMALYELKALGEDN